MAASCTQIRLHCVGREYKADCLTCGALQARRLEHSQLHGDAVDPCCAHIIWRHGQLLASLYTLSVVPFFNMI